MATPSDPAPRNRLRIELPGLDEAEDVQRLQRPEELPPVWRAHLPEEVRRSDQTPAEVLEQIPKPPEGQEIGQLRVSCFARCPWSALPAESFALPAGGVNQAERLHQLQCAAAGVGIALKAGGAKKDSGGGGQLGLFRQMDAMLEDIPRDWRDLATPVSPSAGLRQGNDLAYRGPPNKFLWFHFAVPTPTITDDVRARIKQATVLFRTDLGVQIDSVHIWDGAAQRVLQLDGLTLAGDHFDREDGDNTFVVPGAPLVNWGIGISVRVHFAINAVVNFMAAGVEFEPLRLDVQVPHRGS